MQRLVNQSPNRKCLRALLSASAVVTLASLGVPQSAGAEAPVCEISSAEGTGVFKMNTTWSSLEFYAYLPKSMCAEYEYSHHGGPPPQEVKKCKKYHDDGKQRPLVVALHGCGQNALLYDDETGWTTVADEKDFILLLPSQVKSTGIFPGSVLLMPRDLLAQATLSNVTGGQFLGCFNFYGESAKRNDDEPLAIMTAVAALTNCFNIDPKQIYVTGLSGGAAMTVVMAANYPDCFAGAAPIAGLPFGCSQAAGSGFNPISDCMDVDDETPMRLDKPRGPLARLGPQYQDPQKWGDMVRENAKNVGVPPGTPWPKISAWAGTHDRIVAPGNLDVIARQWSNLHGVVPEKAKDVTEGGYTIRSTEYKTGDNTVVLETHLISAAPTDAEQLGNGHAVPISGDNCGCREHFVEDAGVCASREIAKFWNPQDNWAKSERRPLSKDYCKPIADKRDDLRSRKPEKCLLPGVE